MLSRVRLCDPMNCSPPGSSLHGISQARILEWVATSFSRGSSRPRDRNRVSSVVGNALPSETPGKSDSSMYPFIAPSQTWAAFPSCFSDTGLSLNPRKSLGLHAGTVWNGEEGQFASVGALVGAGVSELSPHLQPRETILKYIPHGLIYHGRVPAGWSLSCLH